MISKRTRAARAAEAEALKERSAREASELAELRSDQTKWHSRLYSYTGAAVLLGFIAFAVLEMFLNLGGFDHLFRPGASPASHAEINWSVGIDNADAAVIGTALLVLVATFNVALGTTDIGAARTPLESLRAASWRQAALLISLSAGVTSLALALTRFAETPGLGIVLVALAVLTILSGGTMLSRTDSRTPLLFRRALISERYEALDRTRLTLVDRFFTVSDEHKLRSKTYGQVALGLWTVLSAAVIAMLTVAPAAIKLNISGSLTACAWGELGQNLAQLYLAVLMLSTIFTLLTLVDVYFWSRHQRRLFILLVVVHAVVVVFWLGAAIWLSLGDTDSGRWLEDLALALGPPGIPLALLGSAALFRRGPGRQVPAFVHSAALVDQANLSTELADIETRLAALPDQ